MGYSFLSIYLCMHSISSFLMLPSSSLSFYILYYILYSILFYILFLYSINCFLPVVNLFARAPLRRSTKTERSGIIGYFYSTICCCGPNKRRCGRKDISSKRCTISLKWISNREWFVSRMEWIILYYIR